MQSFAAVFRHPTIPIAVEPVTLDEPTVGEVRVRLAGCGLCHTDFLAASGALPFPLPAVLGHEGAGVVEAVGPGGDPALIGRSVVLSFRSCGTCPRCRAAQSPYCDDKRALNFSGRRPDGTSPFHDREGQPLGACFFGQSSLARHANVSLRNLVEVPARDDLWMLGALGCGLQTGAGAVLNVLKPEVGASVVIIGLGAVGMAALMAAKASGADPIIAVDRSPERLELARDFGATHTVLAAVEDIPGQIHAITGGGAAYAVECAGSPVTAALALDALAMLGKAAICGAASGQGPLMVDPHKLLYGRSLRGVVQGDSEPPVFIPHLLRLQAAGLFPFERLVTGYDFDDIGAALAAAKGGRAVKAVARMA